MSADCCCCFQYFCGQNEPETIKRERAQTKSYPGQLWSNSASRPERVTKKHCQQRENTHLAKDVLCWHDAGKRTKEATSGATTAEGQAVRAQRTSVGFLLSSGHTGPHNEEYRPLCSPPACLRSTITCHFLTGCLVFYRAHYCG